VLSEDNHLKSPQQNNSEMSTKSCDYHIMDNHDQDVHVTKSTCDRKRMWQEVGQRNTTWSSEKQELSVNQLKKVPEATKRANHKRGKDTDKKW